jgi:hypothetical protein
MGQTALSGTHSRSAKRSGLRTRKEGSNPGTLRGHRSWRRTNYTGRVERLRLRLAMRAGGMIKRHVLARHHCNRCGPVADLMPLVIGGIG